MIELNKVFLSGHLTENPRLTTDPTQTPCCVGTVSNRRTWVTKDKEHHEETACIAFVAWGEIAKAIMHLVKGQAVLIEGKLKQDRSKVLIHATCFQALPSYEPAQN